MVFSLLLFVIIRVHMPRCLPVILYALHVLESIIPKHRTNVSAFISMLFTLTFSANVDAAGHSNWECRSYDVSLFRHRLCVYPDTVTCDLSSHAASRNSALLQPKIAMVPMLCPAQKQYFPGSVHIACCDLWNITPLKHWVVHCRERYTLQLTLMSGLKFNSSKSWEYLMTKKSLEQLALNEKCMRQIL